jgi:hypothetical protein
VNYLGRYLRENLVIYTPSIARKRSMARVRETDVQGFGKPVGHWNG